MTLTPLQSIAVRRAVDHRVSVLTGGPGTGKTFTTNAILDALGRDRCVILSPTGKAAKRAAEVTNHRAMTIHRWVAEGLDSECVVIDETSMVSVDVMAMFFTHWVRSDGRLVLVGDPDQLPSVGPGNILRDIIDSGAVPVTHLDVIHRQAAGSAIISNAHNIIHGVNSEAVFAQHQDWRFRHVPDDDPASALPRILEDYRRAVAQGLDPHRDVQVLSGMRNGPIGVDSLNSIIRNEFNAARGSELWGFAVGDKVINVKNDSQLGVVNGDVGRVVNLQLNGEKHVLVRFGSPPDDFDAQYPLDLIAQLKQAWCLTVHKSQGSEYPIVIVAQTAQDAHIFGRRHLYTAVTRAKRCCILHSSKKAIGIALGRQNEKHRETRLRGLLCVHPAQ